MELISFTLAGIACYSQCEFRIDFRLLWAFMVCQSPIGLWSCCPPAGRQHDHDPFGMHGSIFAIYGNWWAEISITILHLAWYRTLLSEQIFGRFCLLGAFMVCQSPIRLWLRCPPAGRQHDHDQFRICRSTPAIKGKFWRSWDSIPLHAGWYRTLLSVQIFDRLLPLVGIHGLPESNRVVVVLTSRLTATRPRPV